MTYNTVIVTGTVDYFSYKPKTKNFGTISIRLGLPKVAFSIEDNNVNIQNPHVWLNVPVNLNNGNMAEHDEKFLKNLDKLKCACIKAGKITNWEAKIDKDENGNKLDPPMSITRFNFDAYSRDVVLSDRPNPVVNTAIFSGKVNSVSTDGKLALSVPYKKVGSKEYSYRTIPVINSNGYDPTLNQKYILVKGQICGVKPDGTQGLYVVAETVLIV